MYFHSFFAVFAFSNWCMFLTWSMFICSLIELHLIPKMPSCQNNSGNSHRGRRHRAVNQEINFYFRRKTTSKKKYKAKKRTRELRINFVFTFRVTSQIQLLGKLNPLTGKWSLGNEGRPISLKNGTQSSYVETHRCRGIFSRWTVCPKHSHKLSKFFTQQSRGNEGHTMH